MSELFPQLDPPPGGLFRLRRRLREQQKQQHRSVRRLRLLAPVVGAACVFVFFLLSRPKEPAEAVLGAPVHVPAAGVVVDDVALPAQTLPGGTVLVWLPPS